MDVESSGIRSVGILCTQTMPIVSPRMTVEQLAVELERTERLNDRTHDFDCEYEHTLRKINKSSMLS